MEKGRKPVTVQVTTVGRRKRVNDKPVAESKPPLQQLFPLPSPRTANTWFTSSPQ